MGKNGILLKTSEIYKQWIF